MLVADFTTGVFLLWYAPYLLVVFVFDEPCRYNVVTAVLWPILVMPGYVSLYHLILICVERYVAIVHPLRYETTFTDRRLKLAISATWAIGVVIPATYVLWLIDADLTKCQLIPPQYLIVESLLGYVPVCVSLFTCYGRILAIAWRQRRRTEPHQPASANCAAGPSLQTTTVITVAAATKGSSAPPASGSAADSNVASTGAPSVTSGGAAGVERTRDQQWQRTKSRRREFKAVYLTAAIVGTFVILWFPPMLARFLASAGYNPVVVSYLHLIFGAIGTCNFAFSWVIYAAVSKSYRRAYRQMLVRIGCCCCKNVTLPTDHSLVA